METKKGRSYSYILEGIPQALVLRRNDDIVGWNNHKECKLLTDLALEYQHGNQPLFSGPIEMEVLFYFHTPTSPKSKIQGMIHGDPFSQKPSLFLLLNYLEHSAQGRLFADTAQIAHLTCKKVYDAVPRTVFTITELYESKRKSSKSSSQTVEKSQS